MLKKNHIYLFFNFFFFFWGRKRKADGGGGGDWERGRKREKERAVLAATVEQGLPPGAGSTFGTCFCQAGVSIFYLFFPLFKISIDVMF